MPSYSGNPKAQDPSDFAGGMTGQCLCGSITITLKKGDLFTKRNGHLCHCMNCRKATGCVAANNLVVDKDTVEILDPERFLKTYHDSNTGSGLAARRSFCSNCGSPICAIPTDSDEQYVLSLGIFPLIPEPEFELFAAHKHDWEPSLGGTKQYKFMTSSGELDQ